MVELGPQWEQLERTEQSRQHLVVRSVGSAPAGAMFVAVDGAGARHLLVPADEGETVPVDRRSRGVVLIGQDLEVEGVLRHFADLVCVETELREVFVRLCEDVATQVAAASTDGPAVVHRVLSEWRELLSRSAKLGASTSIGLMGELEVLHAGLLAAGPQAIRAWQGPMGAVHDFVTDRWAAEVKTTTVREGRLAEIHGLEQLETPSCGRLVLVWVALRPDPAGLNLYERVQRIIDAGAPRHDLLERLALVGYAHDPADLPEGRWVVRELLWYEVDEGFPRLTVDSFVGGPPTGIQSLRYTVDLAAGPQPLQDSSVGELVAGMS